jgi:hypothetical protein
MRAAEVQGLRTKACQSTKMILECNTIVWNDIVTCSGSRSSTNRAMGGGELVSAGEGDGRRAGEEAGGRVGALTFEETREYRTAFSLALEVKICIAWH